MIELKPPEAVGVPEINPLAPFNDKPAGRLLPLAKAHELIVPVKAGVWENATPTFPVKLCPAAIIGGPAVIEIVAVVAALVPPGPVAVSEIVALPVSCGVPVIAPVVVFSVAQLGKPVAAQLVTGRFVLSVSENVLLNATPTAPEAVCPAVMIGTPSAIVKAILLAALVPPPPVAVKETVNEPLAVGVPVIAPVLAFSESPEGSPVADQELIGPTPVIAPVKGSANLPANELASISITPIE
jgi:hypothetical protein